MLCKGKVRCEWGLGAGGWGRIRCRTVVVKDVGGTLCLRQPSWLCNAMEPLVNKIVLQMIKLSIMV